EIEERQEQPMEVDGQPAEPPKVKRVTRKRELPVIFSSTSLDPSLLEQLKEKEAQMHSADKLVMDTEVRRFSALQKPSFCLIPITHQDRKNALEESVYDMRNKVDARYATYVQPSEDEKLLVALSEAEEWLYTEE